MAAIQGIVGIYQHNGLSYEYSNAKLKSHMFPFLCNFIYLDTLCGTPASGIKIGDTPKAVGTYTNYDHIIVPGGKRPPS